MAWPQKRNLVVQFVGLIGLRLRRFRRDQSSCDERLVEPRLWLPIHWHEERNLDAAVLAILVRIGVHIERNDGIHIGMPAAMPRIAPRQVANSAEPAARGRGEREQLALFIHEEQVIGELPWITRLASAIHLPRRLILISELVTLWQHRAVSNALHEVLDRLSVAPLHPADEQLVEVGGECCAKRDEIALLAGEVVAF